MHKRQTNKAGFTLIEMVITVGILCILLVAATVLYTSYVKKGRRIDGINSLLSISLAEEEYRAKNATYGTLAQVWSGVATSSDGYYTLSITNVAATTYTITATATGAQTGDTQDGTACSALVLSMSSGTISRTPAACWPK
jgi:type IV pilus assembly protein PilE